MNVNFAQPLNAFSPIAVNLFAKVNLPKLTVKVKKLNPNAVLPFYSHENEDMCFDLIAVDYHYDADSHSYERSHRAVQPV